MTARTGDDAATGRDDAAGEQWMTTRLHGDYEEYLEEKLTEPGLDDDTAEGLRSELRTIQRLNDLRDELLQGEATG